MTTSEQVYALSLISALYDLLHECELDTNARFSLISFLDEINETIKEQHREDTN